MKVKIKIIIKIIIINNFENLHNMLIILPRPEKAKKSFDKNRRSRLPTVHSNPLVHKPTGTVTVFTTRLPSLCLYRCVRHLY